MEQIITNVWNLNALLGGIVLLVILIILSLVLIIAFFGVLLLPIIKHDIEN